MLSFFRAVAYSAVFKASFSFLPVQSPLISLQRCSLCSPDSVFLSSVPNPTSNLKCLTSGDESAYEKEVLDSMRNIMDPDLGNDIVSLGFVKNISIQPNSGEVAFNVELTTAACPIKDSFKTQCKEAVEALEWVQVANVTLTSQPLRKKDDVATGLSLVRNIVAVSSCKGGVGKSTTAVNLAFALKELGASVGILDADIYGPSLPTMLRPENRIVEFVGNEIKPLEYDGIKLMSYGYINEGAAIMRGAMVMQLIQQFVSLTSWGSIDYLIIDMPPGTGDIQLTLCQNMNITAAVIVTTPQRLSFTDVVKGIDMFDAVNIPSIAVVENMAYYDEVDPASLVAEVKKMADGKYGSIGIDEFSDMILRAIPSSMVERTIFGNGHSAKLSRMWGISNVIRMPLSPEVADVADRGVPLLQQHPDGVHVAKYKILAEAVVREIAKITHGKSTHPSVSYDETEHIINVTGIEDISDPIRINPSDLRKQCKCAACVEEFTGVPLLDPETVPPSIKPLQFAPIGNYALSVDWSDGHKSLYPYVSFISGYKGRERKLQNISEGTKKRS